MAKKLLVVGLTLCMLASMSLCAWASGDVEITALKFGATTAENELGGGAGETLNNPVVLANIEDVLYVTAGYSGDVEAPSITFLTLDSDAPATISEEHIQYIDQKDDDAVTGELGAKTAEFSFRFKPDVVLGGVYKISVGATGEDTPASIFVQAGEKAPILPPTGAKYSAIIPAGAQGSVTAVITLTGGNAADWLAEEVAEIKVGYGADVDSATLLVEDDATPENSSYSIDEAAITITLKMTGAGALLQEYGSRTFNVYIDDEAYATFRVDKNKEPKDESTYLVDADIDETVTADEIKALIEEPITVGGETTTRAAIVDGIISGNKKLNELPADVVAAIDIDNDGVVSSGEISLIKMMASGKINTDMYKRLERRVVTVTP